MLYTLGSMIMYVTIEPSFLFEKIIIANFFQIKWHQFLNNMIIQTVLFLLMDFYNNSLIEYYILHIRIML
jgi:hypothetical protein